MTDDPWAKFRTLPSTPDPVGGRLPIGGPDDPWAKYRDSAPEVTPGKPFGELKPTEFSYTQRAKQALQAGLEYLGANRGVAQHFGGAAVNIGNMTPMGSVLSAADFTYHVPRGEYGSAALDALGVVPGAIAAKRAVQGIPTRSLAQVPTTQELGQAAKTGYDAARAAPVTYAPQAVDDITAQARMDLTKRGLNPEKAPSTFATLNRASTRDVPPGATAVITPDDLDTLRQQLRTGVPQTQDSLAGKIAIDRLDRYLAAPPPGRVLEGTPQDLAALRRNLAEARGNYNIKKLSEAVEGKIDKAEIAAERAHSGANLDNTTRQWLSSLLTTKAGERSIASALPEEKAAIRAVTKGDPTTNFLRRGGNLLGGGGGSLAGQLGVFGTGQTMGTAWGLAGGLDPMLAMGVGSGVGGTAVGAGHLMRQAANRRTTAAAENVADMIRMRSPEYQKRLAQEIAQGGPPIDPRALSRDAIAYALIPQIRDEDLWRR